MSALTEAAVPLIEIVAPGNGSFNLSVIFPLMEPVLCENESWVKKITTTDNMFFFIANQFMCKKKSFELISLLFYWPCNFKKLLRYNLPIGNSLFPISTVSAVKDFNLFNETI